MPTLPDSVVNMIAQSVLNLMTGWIMLWKGAIVDVPEGWSLCDGTNGTPNLEDRFVIGAGDTYNPDDSDGDRNHVHNFTGDGHVHFFVGSGPINPGAGFVPQTMIVQITGTSDNQNIRPPFYALAYIMRTG